jgi:hypothetical protein
MFDSLTPDELVRAMSNTLRSVASSTATPGSEFDQVQCLSGASIGRYLAEELAHARELDGWFRGRLDEVLTAGPAEENDPTEELRLELSRRIAADDDIDDHGGGIADYLRAVANLPDTEARRQATTRLHRCLRELADRHVLMLLGEYSAAPEPAP